MVIDCDLYRYFKLPTKKTIIGKINKKPINPNVLKITIDIGKATPEKSDINGMFSFKLGIDRANCSFHESNVPSMIVNGYVMKPKA